jgi:hypothetical protein
MAKQIQTHPKLTYPVRRLSFKREWAVLSGGDVLGVGVAETHAEARTAAALFGTMFLPGNNGGKDDIAGAGASERRDDPQG